MSLVAPHPKTRQTIKFWLDVVQGLAVFGGIGGALATYLYYKANQKMELEKPYNEKQLELYVEAARVTARISQEVGPGFPDASKIDGETLTRFWELYYGQLVFVESEGKDSVAAKMNAFCAYVFGPDKCSKDPGNKVGTTPTETGQGVAPLFTPAAAVVCKAARFSC
jgi:hypothetical protein